MQPRNRQTCFTLLKELVQAQAGVLTGQLPALVPGTVAVFKDKTATAAVRIEALAFLRHLCRSHPAAALLPSLPSLLPPIQAATSDRYAKTAVEALHVCLELTRYASPAPSGRAPPAASTRGEGSSVSQSRPARRCRRTGRVPGRSVRWRPRSCL